MHRLAEDAGMRATEGNERRDLAVGRGREGSERRARGETSRRGSPRRGGGEPRARRREGRRGTRDAEKNARTRTTAAGASSPGRRRRRRTRRRARGGSSTASQDAGGGEPGGEGPARARRGAGKVLRVHERRRRASAAEKRAMDWRDAVAAKDREICDVKKAAEAAASTAARGSKGGRPRCRVAHAVEAKNKEMAFVRAELEETRRVAATATETAKDLAEVKSLAEKAAVAGASASPRRRTARGVAERGGREGQGGPERPRGARGGRRAASEAQSAAREAEAESVAVANAEDARRRLEEGESRAAEHALDRGRARGHPPRRDGGRWRRATAAARRRGRARRGLGGGRQGPRAQGARRPPRHRAQGGSGRRGRRARARRRQAPGARSRGERPREDQGRAGQSRALQEVAGKSLALDEARRELEAARGGGGRATRGERKREAPRGEDLRRRLTNGQARAEADSRSSGGAGGRSRRAQLAAEKVGEDQTQRDEIAELERSSATPTGARTSRRARWTPSGSSRR